MEVGLRLAAMAGQLLSKLDWLVSLTVRRRLTVRPVSLAGTFDSYITRTGVQAEAESFFSPLHRSPACHPQVGGAWHPSRAVASEEVVENTGLEPVTSWLQTRRSHS